MNDQTLRKMREMKLAGMAEVYLHQKENSDYNSMDFEDRFQLMIDHEYDRRKSNALNRSMKAADFHDTKACVEDIQYLEDRKLNKKLILQLAEGGYLRNHDNIILKGPTEAGKSYLAQAFGVSACRQYHTVKYVRLSELLDNFALAQNRNDDSYRKLMRKMEKIDLLIMDEFALTKLTNAQATIFLKLTELRYKRKPTIFCTQMDVKAWHHFLGSTTIADAIMDRIVHNSYELMLDGAVSMRERYGIRGDLA